MNKSTKMNNKGFSLIELIIVIAIMAVLVAVIAPNLATYLGSSKKQTDNKNADEIEAAITTALSMYASDQFEDTPAGDIDAVITAYTTVDKLVEAGIDEDAAKHFQANVYSAIKKYVDEDGHVSTKQTGFEFTLSITGDSNAGFECKVTCTEAS